MTEPPRRDMGKWVIFELGLAYALLVPFGFVSVAYPSSMLLTYRLDPVLALLFIVLAPFSIAIIAIPEITAIVLLHRRGSNGLATLLALLSILNAGAQVMLFLWMGSLTSEDEVTLAGGLIGQALSYVA